MANPKNEKRLKNKLLVFFGGLLGPIFLRFFYNTNKWTIDNAHYYQDALSNGKSVIIASTPKFFILSISEGSLIVQG